MTEKKTRKQTIEEAHQIKPLVVPDDVRDDPNWFDPNMLLHGSRVLVKVVFLADDKGDSKIIMPGRATNARDTRAGCVLAAGTGPVDKDGMVLPMPLKAGDYVLFSANTGMQVSHLSVKDDKCFIIGYHEVLAQLPTEDARRMCGNYEDIRKIEADMGKSVSGLSGMPADNVPDMM